ncbi:hypothetical protein CVT25_004505 [Psilocybe cyanescens]|uniref:Uncharacterized protein n=1 Tax=Psilocybe cyanescens TaxID=93625 RepID=A0A409XRV8_PSICY|nr:hypothetical protein CVT25_004505 [Psilocybe cyanescens]
MKFNNNSENAGCAVCQNQVDLRAKAYSRCDMVEGTPCLPCTQFTQLEAKIAEMIANLEKMLGERRQIQTEINQTHDPILRRLPREIASLIFNFAIIPNIWSTELRIKPSKSEMMAPLYLGAVCKAWRELAWATPRLWTSVYAYVEGQDNFTGLSTINESKLDIFLQWISRTGQLPLSVQLRGTAPYHDSDDEPEYDEDEMEEMLENNLGPFIDVLNNYSGRLQNLALFCPVSLLQLFTGNSRGTPLLRCLFLKPWSFDYDPLDEALFSIAARQPQPQVISIDNLRLISVDIDWSNLTDLLAKSFSVQECLEVLKHAPRLKHCDFRVVDLDPTDHTLHPPVQHTTIESLSVGAVDDNYIVLIFDKLTLPALRSLAITLESQWTKIPCDDLASFLERSSCILKSFHIDNGRYDTAKLILLLQSLPSVEELVLHSLLNEDQDHRRVLSRLVHTSFILGDDDIGSQQQQLLPNMRSFSYFIPRDHEIPWDLIPDIFGPLPGQSRPLSVFRILTDWHRTRMGSMDEAVIKRLMDIQAAGVTLLLPWEDIGREDLINPLHKKLLSSTWGSSKFDFGEW